MLIGATVGCLVTFEVITKRGLCDVLDLEVIGTQHKQCFMFNLVIPIHEMS